MCSSSDDRAALRTLSLLLQHCELLLCFCSPFCCLWATFPSPAGCCFQDIKHISELMCHLCGFSRLFFLVICPTYLPDTKERVVSALPMLRYPALHAAAVRVVNSNRPGCSWNSLGQSICQDHVSLCTFGGWQWSCFYSNSLASGMCVAVPQKQSKPKHIGDMRSFNNTSEYKRHQ